MLLRFDHELRARISGRRAVSRVDGNSLEAVGDLTATTLWLLANADEVPSEV